jgi:probable rRNA maturation factor
LRRDPNGGPNGGPAAKLLLMILNRQRSVRVSVEDLDEFLARARRVLRLPTESVSICLVSNSDIARWNRAYRGKKGPTDVLSFRADEENGTRRRTRSGKSAAYLGDIAIAPAVARRNARRFQRTFGEEMRILMLHGMLHLMGYDHETDEGQMERREQKLRRTLGLA